MSRINPAMSDGRAFTSYVSSGLYDQDLGRKFGITDDTAYRAFLQNNSEKVMKTVTALTMFNIPMGRTPTLPAMTRR
jgi:hypothetical protein